ncbi:MAG: hypothetical protein IKN55_06095 [Oscillospiraceae bacterium]|nr:hypothetical protein [Oscillospiraceae bacterium]
MNTSQDTSHYAQCATLMQKYKHRHFWRLILSAIVLYANFFIMTVVWCRNDPTESIRSAVYVTEGKASVNIGFGVFSIIFIALSLIAGIIIFKKVNSNKVRFGYVIAVLAVEMIMTVVNSYQTMKRNASLPHMEGGGVDHLAFGMGILALLFSLGTLALAFFGTQERTKLYICLLVEIVLAVLAGCYHWVFGGVLLLMFLLAIPEYKKMPWIMKQPGYPYFNERFEEQRRHAEYQPDHQLDGKRTGSMLDMDGNPVEMPAAYSQPSAEQPTAAYTMHMGNAPDEMPGIDDILEAAAEPEPLPEPELPRAEDIALPEWNVPDPTLNTAGILSSIPDPGTVPDLPTVPDVPKL